MKCLICSFVLLSSTAFAALPPLEESERIIMAILQDPRTQENLTSAEPIEEIQRSEGGYTLYTRSQMLQVDVEYRPSLRPRRVGPVEFRLIFHPVVQR